MAARAIFPRGRRFGGGGGCFGGERVGLVDEGARFGDSVARLAGGGGRFGEAGDVFADSVDAFGGGRDCCGEDRDGVGAIGAWIVASGAACTGWRALSDRRRACFAGSVAAFVRRAAVLARAGVWSDDSGAVFVGDDARSGQPDARPVGPVANIFADVATIFACVASDIAGVATIRAGGADAFRPAGSVFAWHPAAGAGGGTAGPPIALLNRVDATAHAHDARSGVGVSSLVAGFETAAAAAAIVS